MMALDTQSGPDDDGSGDDEADLGSPSDLNFGGRIDSVKTSLGRIRFSVLLQTILQDSQTRLVFRAQVGVALVPREHRVVIELSSSSFPALRP